MKTVFKWSLYLVGGVLLLLGSCVVVGNLEQKRDENRVRQYFGLPKNEPLKASNIQSALLIQFPIGTPVATVETTLAGRGLDKDGHSDMWQTNDFLYCGPRDYSDGFISMRRIGVSFSLDDQKKVKTIDVDSFSYSF